MANLVQKIVWLLPFALSWATAAPFSHRLHLEKKLTCAVCHAAATTSTKADDNLLPKSAVCTGCHTDTKTIKAPRQIGVAKFNHALHSKFSNIGTVIAKALDSGEYLGKPADVRREDLNTKDACLSCHRGIERSEEVTSAVFPHMADCLVCHNKIDPPFTCSKCHLENAQLKPANHTADWLDRHTSKKTVKDLQSCAVCHGRRFTCLGCH